jgi:hypothetical protein
VSDPIKPTFDSEVNLATNGWWGFSSPLLNGTRVYLSHNVEQFFTNSNNGDGLWTQSSYLDVIDYADPLSPTLRDPVNVPGALKAMANQGELLYTDGQHWDTNQSPDWHEWLDASAYDGVTAHLVASLPLPDSWPHPLLVSGTNIFVARPGYSASTTNTSTPTIETWNLMDTAEFSLKSSIDLVQPAYALVDRNGLFAAQEMDNSLDLFDDSTAQSITPIRHVESSSCLWFDINQADGGVDLGLWLPLGAYGVKQVGLPP